MKKFSKNKGGQNSALIFIGIVLLLISASLMLWFLLSGRTTVTGNFSDNETITSLLCKAKNFAYPFFEYDNANKKDTEVAAIFDNDDRISSIALVQKMFYSNEEDANSSSAINHASMNKSFGVLGADALNVNYYSSDGVMRMQLYASSRDYNSNSRKFFLINNASENIKDIEKNYVDQGFICEKNKVTSKE